VKQVPVVRLILVCLHAATKALSQIRGLLLTKFHPEGGYVVLRFLLEQHLSTLGSRKGILLATTTEIH